MVSISICHGQLSNVNKKSMHVEVVDTITSWWHLGLLKCITNAMLHSLGISMDSWKMSQCHPKSTRDIWLYRYHTHVSIVYIYHIQAIPCIICDCNDVTMQVASLKHFDKSQEKVLLCSILSFNVVNTQTHFK